MVVLLLLVRVQQGAPMAAELTVLAQFIIFIALPSEKHSPQTRISERPLREVLRRS
jgi:hypothetical protein